MATPEDDSEKFIPATFALVGLEVKKFELLSKRYDSVQRLELLERGPAAAVVVSSPVEINNLKNEILELNKLIHQAILDEENTRKSLRKSGALP